MTCKTSVTLLLIAVSITGCATDPLTRNDSDWAQPIKPSQQDLLTRQTKEQIVVHNESGAQVCGWQTSSVAFSADHIMAGYPGQISRNHLITNYSTVTIVPALRTSLISSHR